MSGDYMSVELARPLVPGMAPGADPDASSDVALDGQAWSEIAYEREAVAEIGAEAVCWVIYGELWEFRDDGFYVTEFFRDRKRRLVEDVVCAPPGPWRHYAACGCEVCRLGNV